MLGSSVICILYMCPENSVQGMNKGNKMGQSVTVFQEPRRLMTHIKQ